MDPLHLRKSVISSEIYKSQVEEEVQDQPEDALKDIAATVFQAASDMLEIYSNGKSFIENIFQYVQALLPVFKVLTNQSSNNGS